MADNETRNVYEVGLVKEKLLTSDYYKKQLTLLLRGSYGVPEMIDLFSEILNKFNDVCLGILNLLGTGADPYINIDAINELSTTQSDLLDKIAEIVGCSRYYSFLDTPLDNNDLFILIYFRILQNNFLGTNEEINELYETVFREVGYNDVSISYFTSSTERCTCDIVLNADASKYPNIIKLFEHDMLAVKSVGIKYHKYNMAYENIGFFDGVPTTIDHDTGEVTYDTTSPQCKFDTAYFS